MRHRCATARTKNLRLTQSLVRVRAVTRYGGPEVISLVEEDAPAPRAKQVRVKVLAAGVSLPDVMAREGVHPETPRLPYTPGWDLVGIIDQLGEDVTGFELRQTVAAMPIHGCYA